MDGWMCIYASTSILAVPESLLFTSSGPNGQNKQRGSASALSLSFFLFPPPSKEHLICNEKQNLTYNKEIKRCPSAHASSAHSHQFQTANTHLYNWISFNVLVPHVSAIYKHDLPYILLTWSHSDTFVVNSSSLTYIHKTKTALWLAPWWTPLQSVHSIRNTVNHLQHHSYKVLKVFEKLLGWQIPQREGKKSRMFSSRWAGFGPLLRFGENSLTARAQAVRRLRGVASASWASISGGGHRCYTIAALLSNNATSNVHIQSVTVLFFYSGCGVVSHLPSWWGMCRGSQECQREGHEATCFSGWLGLPSWAPRAGRKLRWDPLGETRRWSPEWLCVDKIRQGDGLSTNTI